MTDDEEVEVEENAGRWMDCIICDTNFFLPEELHTAANCSEAIHFFCPYGHVMHFRSKKQQKEAGGDNVFKLIKGDKE